MQSILKIQDLSYWAGSKPKQQILNSISFELSLGQSLTIIGPNGAGKSTLLKCIARLLSPKQASGKIILNENPLDTLSHREIGQAISYVPQRPLLPSQMKVIDYVLLGRTAHIPTFKNESAADIEVARSVLADIDMEWAAERRLHSLSGGEAQLVVLARSLTSEAPLLLLDEPTASLDLGHCYQLCNLIYELPQKYNMAVVAVMHDLQLAGHFGDELILLNEGELCEKAVAQKVLTPKNIQKYYGISVKTTLGENGGVVVLPN